MATRVVHDDSPGFPVAPWVLGKHPTHLRRHRISRRSRRSPRSTCKGSGCCMGESRVKGREWGAGWGLLGFLCNYEVGWCWEPWPGPPTTSRPDDAALSSLSLGCVCRFGQPRKMAALPCLAHVRDTATLRLHGQDQRRPSTVPGSLTTQASVRSSPVRSYSAWHTGQSSS